MLKLVVVVDLNFHFSMKKYRENSTFPEGLSNVTSSRKHKGGITSVLGKLFPSVFL